MKKWSFLLLVILLSWGLVSCQETENVEVLRIYNWQDYIDDGSATVDENGNEIGTSLLDDFISYYKDQTGKEIEIVYDTFETNEVMFNTLKTGKTTYDLVCPSEYMIQRMIREDMLEKYDAGSTEEYDNNVSPYIKNLFVEAGLDDYARCYMWGTLGLVYDPENISINDVSSWDAMWNHEYKGKVSTKDSIRDTYVVGVMHAYQDELNSLKQQYNDGVLTSTEYNHQLTEIMNRCSDENINDVLKELQQLKKNLFGFEVDSGKTDIVSGKIYMNLAWSGDAVYSMQLAEEEDNKILEYSVPLEGSNIWFDGWVMPKGANKELATAFINFISLPENAVRNMNMIGYTSAIAGDAVFEMVLDWYDESYYDFTLAFSNEHSFESVYDLDAEGLTIFLPYYANDEEDASELIELVQELYENVNLELLALTEQSSVELTDLLNQDANNDGTKIAIITNLIQEQFDNVNQLKLDNEEIKLLSYLDELYEYDLHYFFQGTSDEENTLEDYENALLYTSSLNGQLYTQYPDEDTIMRCGVMADFGNQNDKVIVMWTSVKAADLPTWITVLFFVIVALAIVGIILIMVLRKQARLRLKNK